MIYARNIDLHNTNDSNALLYHKVCAEKTVLDVGCACGDLSALLKQQKKCKVVGIELDDEALQICRGKKIFDDLLQLDMNAFKAEDYPQFLQSFDVIVCGDVLEHLQYPQNVLFELKKLLKSDGCFVVSLPNAAHASVKLSLLLDDWNYTELGILDKTHLRFFTASSIAQLFDKVNLQIDNVSYTQLPPEGYQSHELNELPKTVVDFILSDVQSAVFQYVFCAIPKTGSLYQKNLMALVPSGALKSERKTIVFRIKRFLLLKVPNIIKYIQKLRRY